MTGPNENQKITVVPDHKCLACGYTIRGAVHEEGKAIPPKEGDFCVCSRCGAITLFDAAGELRGLSDAEITEFLADEETMKTLDAMVRRVHFVRSTGHGIQ